MFIYNAMQWFVAAIFNVDYYFIFCISILILFLLILKLKKIYAVKDQIMR